MLDKEFIKNKINFIHKDLKNLAGFKAYSLQEITSNSYRHMVIERLFEKIIGDALDINQHIIAQNKEIEVPNDYKETFLALIKLKILPKKIGEEISKSAGLRNILVHQYRELNEQIFYKSIKSCLRDYAKYCEYILRFIEK